MSILTVKRAVFGVVISAICLVVGGCRAESKYFGIRLGSSSGSSIETASINHTKPQMVSPEEALKPDKVTVIPRPVPIHKSKRTVTKKKVVKKRVLKKTVTTRKSANKKQTTKKKVVEKSTTAKVVSRKVKSTKTPIKTRSRKTATKKTVPLKMPRVVMKRKLKNVVRKKKAVKTVARSRTAKKQRFRVTRVARNESLGVIAQRHGTSVQRLKSLNRLAKSTIHPGQKLIVPVKR